MASMCNRCPQRILILLLKKMGEDTKDFESNGCPWQWQIKVEDTTTKQTKNIDICGIEALPRFLHDYGASHLELAQSVQSMRNEETKGIQQIVQAVKQRMEFDQNIFNQLSNNKEVKVIEENLED